MEPEAEATVAKVLADETVTLAKLLALITTHLQKLCIDLDLKGLLQYRLVEGRVKETSSVIRALSERTLGPDRVWAIDDILGVRVVVVARSDVEVLTRTIRQDRQFPLKHLSRASRVSDTSGYRATHIKGIITHGELQVPGEVQIRTLLEDAWAVVSRLDFYKREGIPPPFLDVIRDEAVHLEATERIFETIRGATRGTPAPPVVAREPRPLPEE